VDETFLESHGGHPATQNALITLVDKTSVPPRLQERDTSKMLQIQGQLDIGALQIMTSAVTYQPINRWGSHVGTQRDPWITAVLERNPQSWVTYRDDVGGRGAEIMLDCFPDEDLKAWLAASDNTIWFLKLAIGNNQFDSKLESKAIWMERDDMQVGEEGYHDFGLILVPTNEDIAALKEIQDKMEAWNIPQLSILPHTSDAPVRGSTPPPPTNNNPQKWMMATQRLNPYMLVGPHNSAFRRIGIYRARPSDHKYYQEHLTTILLA